MIIATVAEEADKCSQICPQNWDTLPHSLAAWRAKFRSSANFATTIYPSRNYLAPCL
jgi:hypothetical protein